MKTLAYVLIQTRPGAALSIAERLTAVPGVQKAHAVTGVYDVICSVSADSIDALATAVVDRIQQVDGITRTETAVVVQSR